MGQPAHTSTIFEWLRLQGPGTGLALTMLLVTSWSLENRAPASLLCDSFLFFSRTWVSYSLQRMPSLECLFPLDSTSAPGSHMHLLSFFPLGWTRPS